MSKSEKQTTTCQCLLHVPSSASPEPHPSKPHPCNVPQAKTEVALQFLESCAAEVALQHLLFCNADVIFTKSCAATNERLHCNIEKARCKKVALSCAFQAPLFRHLPLGPADIMPDLQKTAWEIVLSLVPFIFLFPSPLLLLATGQSFSCSADAKDTWQRDGCMSAVMAQAMSITKLSPRPPTMDNAYQRGTLLAPKINK